MIATIYSDGPVDSGWERRLIGSVHYVNERMLIRRVKALASGFSYKLLVKLSNGDLVSIYPE